MNVNNLSPISRNNMFYSEQDFQMECDIVQGYIEEDLNQFVAVYEVDRRRTNVNDIYKESKNIRFKPPKEIPCMYEIKNSDLKTYDGKTSNGVYTISGNLTMYVMPKTLEKYHCEIKRGDYIGVEVEVNRVVYFTVVDDGKINYANQNHIGAYKTAWRVVECAPVTQEEFNGR